AARTFRALCAVALFLLLCPTAVLADAIGAVNGARTAYCGFSRAAHPALIESRKLDAIARRLARGESLDQAELRADYRAARTVLIRISGAVDDAAIERLVGERFCGQLADPRLQRIGAY